MDHPADKQNELQDAGKSSRLPPRSSGATQDMVVFGLLKLFLLVVGLASVVFTVEGVRLTYNGRRSAGWPSAPGTIIESRVTGSSPRRLIGRESDPMYGADIVYAFRVGDREYTGETVSFSSSSVNQSAAENQVQKYPMGKSVSVYYDPDDPTNSVLEPGFIEDTYILLFSGFMFLFCTLLGCWALVRMKKERSSGPATAPLTAP